MRGKKILFLCDAHLGSGTNEELKGRVLSDFIDRMPQRGVSTLYILGDLFDFWFEYESVILSRYFHFLTALSGAVKSGIEVHLIVGNHDYWAGDFLRNTIGMKIHYAPIEIELDGRRIFICHGDGLNEYDRGYLVLKAIIRNRAILWFVRWVHPDLLLRIAKRFSRFSRQSTSVAGKLREDEGIQQYARRKLEEGFDIVIAGHSHMPHDETISIDGKARRYFNVGDMQEQFSYLEYVDGKFQLKYLKAGQEG
ncbi:MAG: UDP-2,3-diacylglucosamine diphosphatase [Candidatus Abyssobacteria bacterium SURF_5]|uniref:UDP-2,3-diacylglucosamine diphosphatase n=1 Tax=Abyssobacteria bacterium (strain SURF_5) TaxID=2093360 RepID=A0A3A4NHB9_ABYX5|nr:MAG: UDP-2,3-diacylglucosamine diphosphatase [Candidatus Abyssubacteria bacterium SURF_5]